MTQVEYVILAAPLLEEPINPGIKARATRSEQQGIKSALDG
jgi:hypothetical protein